MSDELTPVRERIVRDIASYELESAVTAGVEVDHTLEDVRELFRDEEFEELVDYWFVTVGEWVLSRQDIYERKPEYQEMDGDDILGCELAKVAIGKPTTYGYLEGVSYRESDT